MILQKIQECIAETLIVYGRFTPKRFIQILNTGFAETGYKAPEKDGYWQLEYETVKDLLDNTIPSLYEKDKEYFDLMELAKVYCKEVHEVLINDTEDWDYLKLQIRLVDAKYRTDPEPLPPYNNIWQQAKYWKRVYNTVEGAGTVEHFVREVEHSLTETLNERSQ